MSAPAWATLDVDIATLLARIEQINAEQPPEHPLWDRIITCDVPRLRERLDTASAMDTAQR